MRNRNEREEGRSGIGFVGVIPAKAAALRSAAMTGLGEDGCDVW